MIEACAGVCTRSNPRSSASQCGERLARASSKGGKGSCSSVLLWRPSSRPSAAVAAPATFVLRDGKKTAEPLAFATGVAANGWLLTKASEVENAAELQCQIKGEWVRAQLTWCSPHATLFMFTSIGGTAHSMSRRTLDRLAVVDTSAPADLRRAGAG